MRGATPTEAAAWTLTAGLLAATLFWPDWSAERRLAETRQAAEVVLRRVGERQRVLFDTAGRYAAFGAAPAEREAALPGLELGPGAELFQLEALEALEDGPGALRIRVVTRPDAVRSGAAAPLLQEIEMGGR